MKYANCVDSCTVYMCKTTHLNRKPQDSKTTTKRTRPDTGEGYVLKVGKTTPSDDLTLGQEGLRGAPDPVVPDLTGCVGSGLAGGTACQRHQQQCGSTLWGAQEAHTVHQGTMWEQLLQRSWYLSTLTPGSPEPRHTSQHGGPSWTSQWAWRTGDANCKVLHLLTHLFQRWPIPPLDYGSGSHAGTLCVCFLTYVFIDF